MTSDSVPRGRPLIGAGRGIVRGRRWDCLVAAVSAANLSVIRRVWDSGDFTLSWCEIADVMWINISDRRKDSLNRWMCDAKLLDMLIGLMWRRTGNSGTRQIGPEDEYVVNAGLIYVYDDVTMWIMWLKCALRGNKSSLLRYVSGVEWQEPMYYWIND